MSTNKVLPIDSDANLTGRYEEGDSENNNLENIVEFTSPKPKKIWIWIGIIAFVIVSSGFFSYYFINQSEINSKIIQNIPYMSTEQIMVKKYDIGEIGSDHAHAAIMVIVDGNKINFGLPQFQLSSKYIHFENHNPYLIHKHATGVPLEMLFVSFGMEMNNNCIMLDYDFSDSIEKYCTKKDKSLTVYVNGEKYNSDITQYEINHNDRILISINNKSIPGHLKILDSLEIFDVPEKIPYGSEKEVFI